MPIPHKWYAERSAELEGKTILNRTFYRQVEQIRQFWHLIPDEEIGHDKASDLTRCLPFSFINAYVLGSRPVEALIYLDSFHWGNSVTGNIEPILTITLPRPSYYADSVIFHLQFSFKAPWISQFTDRWAKNNMDGRIPPPTFSEDDGELVMHREIIIQFDRNHPEEAPRLLVLPRLPSLDVHEHHWYDFGGICLSPNNKAISWQSSNYSLNQWMHNAFMWVVWHYQKFGY